MNAILFVITCGFTWTILLLMEIHQELKKLNNKR